MVSELTVIVKDDERTLKAKTLVYDNYMVSENDPTIRQHVDQLISEFAGQPTDISIKISMELL